MNGVLVIDKPASLTSHDVVSRVKRKLGAKKVGHLGTLDPMATGVLVLVIDGATKCARLLDGGKKEYEASLVLGAETDTYDSEGKVTSRADAASVTERGVIDALSKFVGKIRQVPPMYSSVKKNGVPLYKLARKGITIERAPKDIEIYSIVVTSMAIPEVSFSVVCSRGTYVRTLCHDLGKALGCGAHMTRLRRTASGPCGIEGAAEMDDDKDALIKRIIPIEEALRISGTSTEVSEAV
ncbi:MAG: tRNA pseudouridine(55) synthase TruB [Deltaproteobacteria bacterium]|nr:tRNA pseudouridine(55) synthase TruB [Deltaproteobacteria bacterium]